MVALRLGGLGPIEGPMGSGYGRLVRSLRPELAARAGPGGYPPRAVGGGGPLGGGCLISGRRPFEFEVWGLGGIPRPLRSIAAIPFSIPPPPRGGGPRRSRGSRPPGTAGNGLSKLPPGGGGRPPARQSIRSKHFQAPSQDVAFTHEVETGSSLGALGGDPQDSRVGRYIPSEVVERLGRLVQAAGALIVVVATSHAAEPPRAQPGNCSLDHPVLPRCGHHRDAVRSLQVCRTFLHIHRHTQIRAHIRDSTQVILDYWRRTASWEVGVEQGAEGMPWRLSANKDKANRQI